METDILIVGSGLSGSVLAERFATMGKRVLVIDKRDHIGGNCYDYVDEETGIRVSKYGAHIFHTNDEGVWDYVNKFAEWIRYDHKVVANVNSRLVPLPVNMETINVLCNQNLKSEVETQKWLESEQLECKHPNNSEEVGLSRVGKTLYETLFKPYTIKQWGRDPKELDPSVLERIPVRYNSNTCYFSDKYQALPKNGYTDFVSKMLCRPNIQVKLNTEFDERNFQYKRLIFTGPIDAYFNNAGLPKLNYRSLRFETKIFKDVGFVQPSFVINTPSEDVATTRVIEYKHLPYQHSKDSIIILEFPSDEGEPYYPIPSPETQSAYDKYRQLARLEETKGVYFIGRLANYKYFNMDQAIRNSLDFFDTIAHDQVYDKNQ